MSDNLRDVLAAIQAFGAQAEDAMREVIANTALFAELEIVNQITTMDVVDTGRLKGSIGTSIGAPGSSDPRNPSLAGDSANAITDNGLTAIVGTNVSYALAVHDGYARGLKSGGVRVVPGRPFMEAAVPAIEREYERIATQVLNGLGA